MSLQDSRVIETVKVLLKVGADGRGIASVEKTGTSGDVDTYTITLTDQTKYTFDVTNGASIDTIEKTGTSGAVDTYTITLTNGETFTFTVTNGVGTIASDIGYTNTTSQLSATNVQGAIDELAKPTFTEAGTRTNIASGEKISTIFGKIKKWFSDLTDMFVSKTGDTMSGNLVIDRANGTTSANGSSAIQLGNATPSGTVGNSRGYIELYGTGAYFARLRTGALTAQRNIDFPDKTGTVALTSDIIANVYAKSIKANSSGSAVKITPSTNNQTFIVFEVGSHSIAPAFGIRMAMYNASETSQPFGSIIVHGNYETGSMTFSNGKINVTPVQIDSYITVISPANFTLEI